ncbi:MAG: LysR family transcriptional regulator [Thalassolituus sp.]
MTRHSDIDLNLFLVFDAVYRSGSLTQAAAELGVSQPAISQALSRLRQHFDDPLFVRSGRGVAPTPLAKSVIGRVQDALSMLGATVSEGLSFDPALSDRMLTISASAGVESLLLAGFPGWLRSRAPGMHLRFSSDVKSADIVLPLKRPIATDGQTVRKLSKSGWSVVMAEGSEPSLKAWSMAVYQAASHVDVDPGTSGLEVQSGEITRREVLVTSGSYDSAAAVVAAGQACLTLPTLLAEPLAERFYLQIRPLPFHMEPLTLWLSARTTADPAVAWLSEQLAEYYQLL